jgi:hypothetical protein
VGQEVEVVELRGRGMILQELLDLLDRPVADPALRGVLIEHDLSL